MRAATTMPTRCSSSAHTPAAPSTWVRSRAFARRRPAARQPVAPAQLLRQTVQLLQPTLPSSMLIEVDAGAPGLPAIEADAVQLEQVLVVALAAERGNRAVGGGNFAIGSHRHVHQHKRPFFFPGVSHRSSIASP